jgi:uncharacterized protein with HEPN domain
MRGPLLYLTDILKAMNAIESFVEDMDFDSFIEDLKTTSAVTQQLQIIGEAAKHVPDNIRQNCPGVDWRSMAGMRDRLIHAYFGTDLAVVWGTIQNTMPKEKLLIQKLLSELNTESGDS